MYDGLTERSRVFIEEILRADAKNRLFGAPPEMCSLEHRTVRAPGTVIHEMTDAADLVRLFLKLERDVAARTQLRTLLTAADATVARRRRDLRAIRARIARRKFRRRQTL